jgi:NADH dehydrogenase (ubiquinone) 1 beta subcomplex subunit 8
LQLHEQEELYSMYGPDVPHVDPGTALRHFCIAFGGLALFGVGCKYLFTPDIPAVRREYPYDGLTKEMGGLGDNAVRRLSLH